MSGDGGDGDGGPGPRGGVPSSPGGAASGDGPVGAVAGPSTREDDRAAGSRLEALVLAAGVLGALAVWLAFPSAGNYDTVLDLVWAREILDGGTPGFESYAASTPHPLWVLLGLPVVGIFGADGDRVMVLVSALSLAVLAAGTVRLGRIAGEAVAPSERAARTGRATGLVAGLLVLSSFAFGLLAAKGYLDVPFLALVAWAGAWALRPRRGERSWAGPAVLLALAGLLRPEAWILAGGFWLWCTVPGAWGPAGRGDIDGGRPPGRAPHLLLVLVAPVLWVLMDLWATGNPLHSLTATSQLADDLGRDRGIAKAPRLLASQLVDQSRPPVFVAGLAGLGVLLLAPRLGLRRVSRPVRTVLVTLLVAGVLTFLAAGVGGLSLIPRYLSVPVVAITVLAALATTGWVGLPGGARGRQAWTALVVVGAVLGVGAYLTVKRDSVSSLGSELRFIADARRDVRALIDDPAVRRGVRCGPVSLPTYRLVPEVRLQLDADGREVLARSDPRARRLGAASRGVAITVDEDALGGKWRRRYAQADGVRRSTKPAPAGFRPVARSGAFTASVRCGRGPGGR